MKNIKYLIIVSVLLIVSCQKYKGLEDGLYAEIQTDKGDVLLKLFADDTPLTVSSFVSLAEGTNPSVSDSLKGRKFYDGLTFHRVMKDFMIQGGDPLARGTGGPGYRFEDEFALDSLGKLKYRHDGAGVLSMANGGKGTGTNGSQFFITHKATPWLDSVHTVFGKVVFGQNIVDSIQQKDVIKHIEIMRIGDAAKNFDAASVFKTEYEKSELVKQKRLDDMMKQEEERYAKFLKDKEVYCKEKGIDKAVKTASGLQILTLKKGSGKKVTETEKITMHYTLALANGKKIQSTEGRAPFTFTINAQPMMAGFKEGVLKMREGGKARLFIPYYIAYGEAGGGPFPPKADLCFDIEILKVEK